MNNYRKIISVSLTAVLLLASCQKEEILLPRGDQLDASVLEYPVGTRLNCNAASGDTLEMDMNQGDRRVSLEVYASLTKPSETNQNVMIQVVDNSWLSEFVESNKMCCLPLQESFISFPDGNSLVVPAGKTDGLTKAISVLGVNPAGNELAEGRYLTAFRLISEQETNLLFLYINVRKPFVNKYELYTGEDMFMVFYLNTNQFDPRLVTDFSMMYISMTDKTSGTIDIGRILNLRKSSILWNKEERTPYLNLYPDLKYVLEHRSKYIQPVQDSGRKVCLCIQGGGQGIGFCNLNDKQSELLAGQIADIIMKYELDGVNLWDKGSNYGKEGMPPVDKKSYPAFIKLLRDKIGSSKLITLVDFEEPTESFGDVEACGGIEVGKLIDYAWSGYCDNRDEKMAVVDPYYPTTPGVSKKYPRQPIAGLSSKRYGCINAFWKANNRPTSIYDDIALYEQQKVRSSGIFVYGEDIRSNMQDQYEGSAVPSNLILQIAYAHKKIYMIQMGRSYLAPYYGKWLKDW